MVQIVLYMDRWGWLKRILQRNTGDALISNLCSTVLEWSNSCLVDTMTPTVRASKHGKVKEVERVFKFIIFILDIPNRSLLAKNPIWDPLVSTRPASHSPFSIFLLYFLFEDPTPSWPEIPYSSMWFVGVSLDSPSSLFTFVNLSWSFFWKVG